MNYASELILALGLLSDTGASGLPLKEVNCLAQNIYHEARGESFKGRMAVAYVTMNRVEDERWPDTICGVVYQKKQFSWTAHGKVEVKNSAAYEDALAVAISVMTGVAQDPTHGATYFYDHKSVTPRWSHRFETVAVIGGHTFKR